MRVKTASVLDFLSLPQKTSSSLYEVLAKEAADAYEKDQTPPNQTIAKQASARGFNTDQIHRVVELANHQINTVLSKSAEDQLFTFPVASVEGVHEAMGSSKGSGKTASTEEPFAAPDMGIYGILDQIPDYVDLLASRRFEQKLAGLAKEAEEEPTWRPEHAPEAVKENAIKSLNKKAAADVEYAELVLREALSGVRQEWEKIAESDEDQLEFLYAGAAVLGIPGVQQLAGSFGEGAEKVAESLDPGYLELIAQHMDTSHPVVQGFEALRKSAEDLGSVKEAAAVLPRVKQAVPKHLRVRGGDLVQQVADSKVGKTISRPVPKVMLAGGIAYKAAPKVGLESKPTALQVAKTVAMPNLERNKEIAQKITGSLKRYQ